MASEGTQFQFWSDSCSLLRQTWEVSIWNLIETLCLPLATSFSLRCLSCDTISPSKALQKQNFLLLLLLLLLLSLPLLLLKRSRRRRRSKFSWIIQCPFIFTRSLFVCVFLSVFAKQSLSLSPLSPANLKTKTNKWRKNGESWRKTYFYCYCNICILSLSLSFLQCFLFAMLLHLRVSKFALVRCCCHLHWQKQMREKWREREGKKSSGQFSKLSKLRSIRWMACRVL